MKYYKIELDMEREGIAVCHGNNSAIEVNAFCRAQEEQKLGETFRFTYSKSEGNILTDMLANDKGWFVVSEKFKKQVLDVINSNVQVLDVNVECENDGTCCAEYYICCIS